MTVDVVVIGAGVSGLATAYALSGRGYRVVVLERQVRAGGSAVSERIGPFLMEHGPSVVNAASGVVAEWSHALTLDAQRCDLGPDVNRRYLVRDGSLCAMSIHPLGLFTSPYLSLRARLRVMGEVFVPPARGVTGESVAAFARRRFGREFAERLVEPLVGGLYAGRADELSVGAVFPKLVEMERRAGSITRAALGCRLRGGRLPARRLFSWRGGIATLPRALAGRLGGAVRTGVAVRHIRPTRGGFRIEAQGSAVEARAVVLASQPHVAAALLEEVDPRAAEALAAIETPPLAVVFLGYRRNQVAHPLDGLGYLAPRAEGRAVSGVLFCSTMFPGRAPEGHVALAGYVGGARAPDLALLPAPELAALVRAEVADLLGAKGTPAVSRVRHWAQGLPQYRLGHEGRIAALRAAEGRLPGLFATGNYFSGPSVAACLAAAEDTAARVHRLLAARGRESREGAVA